MSATEGTGNGHVEEPELLAILDQAMADALTPYQTYLRVLDWTKNRPWRPATVDLALGQVVVDGQVVHRGLPMKYDKA